MKSWIREVKFYLMVLVELPRELRHRRLYRNNFPKGIRGIFGILKRRVSNRLLRILRFEIVWKEVHIFLSRKIPVENISTICVTLGPYRNLTTLSASIIALHPNCQVLNHGGRRVLYDKRLDFLLNNNDDILNTFLKYAIFISQRGRRGNYGGSIVFSHAFDKTHKVREIYTKRFGSNLLHNEIKTLFWKESLMTTNHIRDNHVDLEELFSKNQSIKFLMPIRNPIDCAISNLKTNHFSEFNNLTWNCSPELVVDKILDEYLWYFKLKLFHSDRFFHYYEHEFSRITLIELSNFLNVEADEEWIEDSLDVFVILSKYNHSRSLIEYYRKGVVEKFSNFPNERDKLLRFVDVRKSD